MGSFRFMFSFGTNLLIQSITFGLVASFWRWGSSMENCSNHILYRFGIIIKLHCLCFSVKELSDAELEMEKRKKTVSLHWQKHLSYLYLINILS